MSWWHCRAGWQPPGHLILPGLPISPMSGRTGIECHTSSTRSSKTHCIFCSLSWSWVLHGPAHVCRVRSDTYARRGSVPVRSRSYIVLSYAWQGWSLGRGALHRDRKSCPPQLFAYFCCQRDRLSRDSCLFCPG